MNVLAFDTCFSSCSVAISAGPESEAPRVEFEHREMDTGHAEALIPMIQRVATRADVAFAQIDRIVVTNGPGTFTGIRTGVAVARALALSTGAKIVAVSSLWAVGAGALETGALPSSIEAMIVAIDARKRQIYAQVFDMAGRELTEPQLLEADQVAGLVPELRVAVLGSGASAVIAASQADRRVISPAQAATFSASPDARHLLAAADRSSIVGPLMPHYLRPPDAKPQAGKSLPWSTP